MYCMYVCTYVHVKFNYNFVYIHYKRCCHKKGPNIDSIMCTCLVTRNTYMYVYVMYVYCFVSVHRYLRMLDIIYYVGLRLLHKILSYVDIKRDFAIKKT